MGVAVADKAQAWAVSARVDQRGEPDLADAALHLVGGGAVFLGQGLEPPSKLDDVAITVLPVVEKLEIGKDLVKVRLGASLVQRVHDSNIGRNGGGDD